MNCEAIHCPESGSVRFAIYPDGFDGPRIIARISERALRQRFGADTDEASLLGACQAHFGLIEAKALASYAARPQVPVLLVPGDFDAVGAVDTLAEAL
jgi:hypothetical protein